MSAVDAVRTTDAVQNEVLVGGTRGTAALDECLEEGSVHEPPDTADEAASMEGIAVADASVILLAADDGAVLLANDKGLIEVARSHGVECWWVTTLLLRCTRDGTVTTDEATDVLYDLVNEGMNLYPKVYTQVQKKLGEPGD